MSRHLRPALAGVGLEWVSFLVMRRTYSSLLFDQGVDPKVVADMLGHGIGVNLNVYTRSSIARRREASETVVAVVS